MCYLEQAHAGRCLRLAHRCVTDKVVLSSKTADYQLGEQNSATTTTMVSFCVPHSWLQLFSSKLQSRSDRVGHFGRVFQAS
jgi:hypothetical protein